VQLVLWKDPSPFKLNTNSIFFVKQTKVFHYFTPQTGTPDKILANPTPNPIKVQVPNTLMNINISTLAPLGLTPNFL